MTFHSPRAWTALLPLCALTACSTDTPLETRPPTEVHPVFDFVATSDTLVASADAYVRVFAPNKNYGTEDSLTVRSFTGSTNRYSVYIRVDQAAIASQIGGGQLDSARLELMLRDGSALPVAGTLLNAYRIPSSWAPGGWTETGVTANCPNDTNTSNAALNCPAGMWDTTGFGTLAPTDQRLIKKDTRDWVGFDVTADIAAFLAGTANQGWYLIKQNNNNNERMVFWSRESTSKPRLILYVTGPESVPAHAPDSEPSDLYDLSRMEPVSANSPIDYERDAISILFSTSASTAERADIVGRVQGQVIGGTHITPTDGFYILRIPDPGSVDSLERILSSLDTAQAVDLAIPEYVTGDIGNSRRPDDGESFRREDYAIFPEDARGDPWYLTAINAPLAWGCSTGDSTVPVAVVDENIYFINPNFPDITPAISFRTNKVPGNAHGVFVSSILAARGNNQTAMTGMMWSSNLRLYDVIELDPQNGGPVLKPRPNLPPIPARHPRAVASRISKAILDGARVVNLSFGLLYPTQTPTAWDSLNARRWVTAVAKALNAWPAASRPLLVVSAGNDGVDAWWSSYPQLASTFPDEVLVVAGSNRASNALFNNADGLSNYGSLVSIAAPGEQLKGLNGSGILDNFGQTSGSTPLVSGTAGLLLAFDPSLTTDDLHDLILEGATAGGRTAGFIPILDAYESLRKAAKRPGTPICGFDVSVTPSRDTILLDRDPPNAPERIVAPWPILGLSVAQGGRLISLDRGDALGLLELVSGSWVQRPEVQGYNNRVFLEQDTAYVVQQIGYGSVPAITIRGPGRSGTSISIPFSLGETYVPANARGFIVPASGIDPSGQWAFVEVSATNSDLTGCGPGRAGTASYLFPLTSGGIRELDGETYDPCQTQGIFPQHKIPAWRADGALLWVAETFRDGGTINTDLKQYSVVSGLPVALTVTIPDWQVLWLSWHADGRLLESRESKLGSPSLCRDVVRLATDPATVVSTQPLDCGSMFYQGPVRENLVVGPGGPEPQQRHLGSDQRSERSKPSTLLPSSGRDLLPRARAN